MSKLTLLTWNVQWFCGLDDIVSVDRVIAHAQSLCDFDVLCLQEVAVDYPSLTGDAGFDQVQRVRERLPGYEVRFGAAVDELGRHGRRQRFGNLIASRLPVAQVQKVMLPYPADGCVRSMPRICVEATLATPLGPLRVMTTHLEFYSPRQRLAQAEALLALHAQSSAQAAAPPQDDETGEPFQNKLRAASAILCGDFNCETDAAEYLLLQSTRAPAPRFVDAWPRLHGSILHAPTFCVHDRRHGPVPIACDFCFVTEDLAPRLRRVEVDTQCTLSDHQPVWVELD
jgi:endonuclease/exonuclease/phosphatase family metal-dependent hydrolase